MFRKYTPVVFLQASHTYTERRPSRLLDENYTTHCSIVVPRVY